MTAEEATAKQHTGKTCNYSEGEDRKRYWKKGGPEITQEEEVEEFVYEDDHDDRRDENLARDVTGDEESENSEDEESEKSEEEASEDGDATLPMQAEDRGRPQRNKKNQQH